MDVWSMSWFTCRNTVIEDEILIVVLSDGLCKVAEMIYLQTDLVNKIFVDTSWQIETVLTTFSTYRDDRDIWDVQKKIEMFVMLMMTISEEYLPCWGGVLEFVQLYKLFLLYPPMGDYTDVITHVNPRKNQCKLRGKNTKEKNKNKIIVYFPKVG